ncbi:HMG-box domain-containing protein [Thalassoroseus pseudoceratinae]|uniref:hypothetical protein n=1 Tax=Thalassoroseus pseudoceratinae TaxID=2713176 RepID=UPI00197E4BD4|nr:hypothetical protein [Thalassoroseus pseudoceratinae]
MRSAFTKLFLGSVLFSAVALVGCSQSPTDESTDSADASLKTFNAVCPIMGSEVSADAPTVEWNGKTIGFCCAGCDEKWEALSDDEKAEKLAAAEKEADETDDAGEEGQS